jgi:alpha-amylase/alpha-mannosidase (GH57 family)
VRYVCIHGHFYQPPRENPWTGTVEGQADAAPYHDWNARVTAECYRANAAARLRDAEGRVLRTVNNYARMSFDFGPTLLTWLEREAPDVYQAILGGDRESRARYGGHGGAIAQAYNHMILPLANRRDKVTQVRWGIRDFAYRLGRTPEGIWLPETAVDLETLEVLAEQGIRFTILAPGQARRVQPEAGGEGSEAEWRDVGGGTIDPSRAYRQRLSSGRRIALFFYDGTIARAVAFEGLLASGEQFVQRIRSGFVAERPWPQLVHIATDGESYGHHHRYGEMALAFALLTFAADEAARLTTYGAFLAQHPPTAAVEIAERTAWSCAHGVERWRSDCGCNSGRHPGWHQAWRAPLREALDWLRDALAARFAERAGEWLSDPWSARDDAIDLWLDRSAAGRERFFARHAARPLGEAEQQAALDLLELQRQAMLMYASDGWFFDDISGIETVQVLRHAGRAIDLAERLFGATLESEFLRLLARAPSNVPEARDGAHIYAQEVRPLRRPPGS